MSSPLPKGPPLPNYLHQGLGIPSCENLGGGDSFRQLAIDLSETQAQGNLPVLLGLQLAQCMSQPAPCTNAPENTASQVARGLHRESLIFSSLVKIFTLV